MKHALLATTAIMAITAAFPAFADAETEALRKQVKLLEARLEQLEKKQAAANAAALAPSAGGNKNIENRVAIVERKQELADEATKAAAEKNPTIEVGSKGFAITSPDKQYSVRMRAYGQFDTRSFQDNSNSSNVDNFLLRSARPVITAKMTDYASGQIMLDFGNNQTRLVDAYVDAKPFPDSKLFNVRLGKQKTPVGLERWQAEQEVEFVERSMTTNLVPFRDIGVIAFGEIVPDQLEYQLGVTNGATDLSDNTGATNDNKDINARIFAYPFRWAGFTPIRGLGLGVAGTYGSHTGTSSAQNTTAGYVTIGQSRFFTYRTTAIADGADWRFNPQAIYSNGPFGAMGEYVKHSQRLHVGSTYADIENDAWWGMVSYVLTGEDWSFEGIKVSKDHEFDLRNGKWGAFELVARAGELTVDNDAFTTFADSTASARRAKEFAGGLTWHVNNSLKFNFDYGHTTFDGGAAGGADRESENVFLTRTQFRF